MVRSTHFNDVLGKFFLDWPIIIIIFFLDWPILIIENYKGGSKTTIKTLNMES